MKMITTEVLEQLVYLAALTQKHTPALDAMLVSKVLVKMQKLAVTLRSRDNTGITNEMVRNDYDHATRDHENKIKLLAATIGISCEHTKTGGIMVTVGDKQQRLF